MFDPPKHVLNPPRLISCIIQEHSRETIENETAVWFELHFPGFPQEHQDYAKDMTGSIPPLLRSLSRFNNEFNEAAFLDCREFEPVTTNILSFYENINLR